MAKNYWLFKSEPGTYPIDDLARDGKTYWDGVRNYQARNFLRDRVKKGDLVFFYHSNAEPAGIAGLARVAKDGYPDPSAWDPQDRHYDPLSKRERPVWYGVDIEFVRKFDRMIPLETLRKVKGLEKMPLLKRGQRLSVQPVSQREAELILGTAALSKKRLIPA